MNEVTDQALRQQYDYAKQAFERTGFHTKRDNWRSLINREHPIKLPEDLVIPGLDPDYQTPDLEWALQIYKSITTHNPTYFDVVNTSPKDTKAVKAAIEEMRLWVSSQWKHALNVDGWWDDAQSEGQWADGIKIGRLNWKPWAEPEMDKELADDAALDTREAAYARMGSRFYLEDIDLGGMVWLEIDRDADVAFYEAEIPVIEANAMFKKAGDGDSLLRPYVDSLGHLGWIGEATAIDQALWQKKVKVLVRDARDPSGRKCPLEGCDHPMRTITLWLRGDSQQREDGEQIEEVDSPFPGCSFLITAAFTSSSRNPNLRYRPGMYPLLVEADRENFLSTTIVGQALKDYSSQSRVIDGSKINPAVMIGEGGIRESYKLSDMGPDEIQVLPALPERVENPISEHLVAELNTHRQRMGRFMPSPYLTGQNYLESQDPTATQSLQQAAAASVPISPMLKHQDATTYRIFQYIFHAIRFFGDDAMYFATTYGDEDLASGSSKAGRSVFLTKAKLEALSFELQIKTQSETLAEETQRYLIAKRKRDDGVYTEDDLMRAAGVRDVEDQKEKLFEADIREAYWPTEQAHFIAVLDRIYKVLTGIDDGRPPVEPPLDVGREAMGNGGRPPSATGMMGRSMNQPLVEGPSGGNFPGA